MLAWDYAHWRGLAFSSTFGVLRRTRGVQTYQCTFTSGRSISLSITLTTIVRLKPSSPAPSS